MYVIDSKSGITFEVIPAYSVLQEVTLTGPPVPGYTKKILPEKVASRNNTRLDLESVFYAENGCFEEMLEKAVPELNVSVNPAVAITSPLSTYTKSKGSANSIAYEQAIQFAKKSDDGFNVAGATPLRYDSQSHALHMDKFEGDLSGLAGVLIFSAKNINLSKYFSTPKISSSNLEITSDTGNEIYLEFFAQKVEDGAIQVEDIKGVDICAISPSLLAPVTRHVKFEKKGQIHEPNGELLLAASYLV